jgi:hypothetical protein
MPRTGTAALPLHGGKAPPWLFRKMVGLAGAVTGAIVEEYGSDEFLRRISHPHWFQAFSCVLGFDWHSSGTTTVTCGALKEALKKADIGLSVVGGKGAVSRTVPEELAALGKRWDLGDDMVRRLAYSSRMCAKVDTSAIQDGHQIYHHAMLLDIAGKWAVIQQGLDESAGYARRYHWLSEKLVDFVVEPHEGIAGDIVRRDGEVLDLTARTAGKCRKVSVDLVAEGPGRIKDLVRTGVSAGQSVLEDFGGGSRHRMVTISMPRGINWDALRKAYEFRPKDYEELLALRGIGPSTVRALALISEVIYGAPPSWKDPVKFSFAVGGKDGVPFPVDRRAMDESTRILQDAVDRAKGIEGKEQLEAIRRMRRYVPADIN